mmetsp:Transcript_37026/g.109144  ORF Transcript_37026/g.109144 Transcript_37026/m.109144 type:complete len:257 (-) Transcript_37026:1169-1939(-)
MRSCCSRRSGAAALGCAGSHARLAASATPAAGAGALRVPRRGLRARFRDCACAGGARCHVVALTRHRHTRRHTSSSSSLMMAAAACSARRFLRLSCSSVCDTTPMRTSISCSSCPSFWMAPCARQGVGRSAFGCAFSGTSERVGSRCRAHARPSPFLPPPSSAWISHTCSPNPTPSFSYMHASLALIRTTGVASEMLDPRSSIMPFISCSCSLMRCSSLLRSEMASVCLLYVPCTDCSCSFCARYCCMSRSNCSLR